MFRSHWLASVSVLENVGGKARKSIALVVIAVSSSSNGKEIGQNVFVQKPVLSLLGVDRLIQTGVEIGGILAVQTGKNKREKREKETNMNVEFVGGSMTKTQNCQV